MRLSDVMDDVAARLKSVQGLNVWAYPAGSVTPPAAVVSYPDEYDVNAAYQRGTARITLPVVVVVGKADERSARDRLSAYVDGSGASSIVAVLQSGSYTAFDSLAVTGIEFDVVRIGATDYLAALFDLDIMGTGR